MAVNGLNPSRFGSVSMVTATLGTNDPEVGTRCIKDGNEYIFVYNAGNSQISPGYGAIVSGVSGYSVTVSSVASTDHPVGVCKHSTLTTGTYGWLLTKGFSEVKMGANASAAAGGTLVLEADGAFGVKSISTGVPQNVAGKAMAAIASGASGTAFLKLL